MSVIASVLPAAVVASGLGKFTVRASFMFFCRRRAVVSMGRRARPGLCWPWVLVAFQGNGCAVGERFCAFYVCSFWRQDDGATAFGIFMRRNQRNTCFGHSRERWSIALHALSCMKMALVVRWESTASCCTTVFTGLPRLWSIAATMCAWFAM